MVHGGFELPANQRNPGGCEAGFAGVWGGVVVVVVVVVLEVADISALSASDSDDEDEEDLDW